MREEDRWLFTSLSGKDQLVHRDLRKAHVVSVIFRAIYLLISLLLGIITVRHVHANTFIEIWLLFCVHEIFILL